MPSHRAFALARTPMLLSLGVIWVMSACGQQAVSSNLQDTSDTGIMDADTAPSTRLDVERPVDDVALPVDAAADSQGPDMEVSVQTPDDGDSGIASPPAEGEWCTQAWPFLLDSIPGVVSGDTSGLNDDTANLTACATLEGEGGGPDGVFFFVPQVTARYHLTLTPSDSGPDQLHVLSSCDTNEALCIGSREPDGSLLVDLDAGEGVFVVVDGSDLSRAGAFEVVVDIVVDGDRCDVPVVVAQEMLPFDYVADTTFADDDYHLGGGCDTGGNIGEGAPDIVFEFQPQYGGHYVMGLSPLSVIGDSPAVLYVLTDCEAPGLSCVEVSANLAVGGLMSVYLEAGQDYIVVVDGLLAQDKGPFSFFIKDLVCIPQCPGPECGKDGCGGFCGEGCAEEAVCSTDGLCVTPPEAEANQCSSAVVVDTFPFATTRDTYYGSNDASFAAGQCPGEPNPIGMTANDHVFALSPSQTGLYTVQLSSAFDGALYVTTSCLEPGSACLIGSDSSLNLETFEVLLEAGQAYYLWVDGYGNGQADMGQYTLQISAPCIASCDDKVCGGDGCGGSCGLCPYGEVCDDAGQCVTSALGDDCLNPFVVDAIPFSDSGNTAEYQDDFSFTEGDCPGVDAGWGAASNDVVYRFEPEEADLYAVSVEASFDSIVYVVTDCGDIGSACVGADDQDLTGEVAEVWMYPGTTYFIIVDGYGNQSNALGDYSLSIAPACAPACKFKACGPDGCGGVCGECEGSLQCTEAGLCEALDGNGCDTPFLADGPLPLTLSGDTSDAVNMLGVPYDACPGETAVRGPRSADEVWLFTPETSGVYTLTLEASFESVLYILTDCEGFGLDCFVEKEPDSALVWFDVTNSCVASQYTPGLECAGIGSAVGIQGSTVTVLAPLVAGTDYFIVVDGRSYAVNESGPYTLDISEPCQPQCEGKVCGDDGCGMSCGVCPPQALCDPEQQCTTPVGNTCEDPFVIDAEVPLPVIIEGTTLSASNTYGMTYGGCPLAIEDEELRAGAGSRDHVYAFTPAEGGLYDITLEANHLAVTYILTGECESYLSSCYYEETKGHNTWTADKSECFFPGTCLGMGFTSFEEGEISVELEASQTVFIVVDGLGGLYDAAGAYTLTVDLACQPQCEDKACGPDGCGDVCGTCGGGLVCSPEGLCVDEVEAQGNACINPWLVDTIPFLGVGTTTNKSALYDPSACVSTTSGQSGIRDEVWLFTPQQSGIYLIDVVGEGLFDPVFWMMTDCGEEDEACLKGSASGTMDVSLDATQSYYLIVEGRQDPEEPELAEQGTYTVEITLP